jgi:Protein of unknown function (DUF1628).
VSRADIWSGRVAQRRGDERGITSPLATVLLTGVVVGLSGVVATGAFSLADTLDPAPPSASLSGSISGDRITLVHRGGDPISLRELRIRVEIDGTPLVHEPPVPFFAAEGFCSGPTGPFNRASSDVWRPGERGSFRIATTNEPYPESGDAVEIYLVIHGHLIATIETSVTETA